MPLWADLTGADVAWLTLGKFTCASLGAGGMHTFDIFASWVYYGEDLVNGHVADSTIRLHLASTL